MNKTLEHGFKALLDDVLSRKAHWVLRRHRPYLWQQAVERVGELW